MSCMDTSLEQLTAKLMQMAEQRRQRSKVEREMAQLETTIKNQSQSLEDLERRLKREQVDVDQLERLSLASLVNSLFGKRDEKLAQERQELTQAQLRYQSAKGALEINNRSYQQLRETLAELNNVDREYERLLREKERLLQDTHPEKAAAVIALSEKLAQANADLVEVQQAISAGNQADQAVYAVINALESAGNWGTWDMLGGGLLATAAKHSRIDEARYHVDEAQAYLERFKHELADVRGQIHLGIEIGDFETFADFFFDGLLVDWLVQTDIENALHDARDAEKRISQAMDRLSQLERGLQQQINEIKAQRMQAIEAA